MHPASSVRAHGQGQRPQRCAHVDTHCCAPAELGAAPLRRWPGRDAGPTIGLRQVAVAAAHAEGLPTDLGSQLIQMSGDMLSIRQSMDAMLSTADKFLEETSLLNTRLKLRTQDESLVAAVTLGVRRRQRLAAPMAVACVADVAALLQSVRPAQQLEGAATGGGVLEAPEDIEERLAAGLDDVSCWPAAATALSPPSSRARRERFGGWRERLPAHALTPCCRPPRLQVRTLHMLLEGLLGKLSAELNRGALGNRPEGAEAALALAAAAAAAFALMAAQDAGCEDAAALRHGAAAVSEQEPEALEHLCEVRRG
jgi:hypothetical protein